MKKLITSFNGGFPFVLDDLRWMDAGINEALFAVCRSMLPPGSNAVILTGCAFDVDSVQDQISMNAGWLYYNEDGTEYILKVDQQTFAQQGFNIALTGNTLRWNNTSVADAGGSKIFYDNMTHNTYIVRKAILTMDDDPALPSFLSTIRETDWLMGTLASGFVHVSGRNMYYRLRNGCVEFRGEINGGAGYIMTLPKWCWPTYTYKTMLTVYNVNDNMHNKMVEITTTGVVSIVSSQSGPDYQATDIPFNFTMTK